MHSLLQISFALFFFVFTMWLFILNGIATSCVISAIVQFILTVMLLHLYLTRAQQNVIF